jgi:hypothetical protein
MARRHFNDGQEVTSEDLSAVAPALEQVVLDRVLPELTNRLSDRFFGKSCKVGFVNSTTVSIDAGIGIQLDSGQTSPEPKKRLLYNPSSSNHTITSPHATNNRIDIVSVKAVLSDELTSTRKFKDAGTSAISNVSMTVQKDWRLDVVITKGVEDGSLAVPATPSGYIKIAELTVTAVTGLSGASAISDKRARFPVNGYDAVVGTSDYCTHATLADAVGDANVLAGAKILVENNETISTPVSIAKNNLQIDFKPGVTFTKGGSATEALTIGADGVRINGGRFASFSSGGDRGIRVTSGSDYAILFGQRFASCTLDVLDDSGTATILANVIE